MAILLLIAVLVALALIGPARWNRDTHALRARLEAARVPPASTRVDFTKFDGLPAPVQRYFRAVLRPGAPIVLDAAVHHTGSFNMGEDRDNWKPFTSDQLVVTRRPGFDWDARVAMFPGAPVHVHDAYVAGEGMLHAAILGLVTVADVRGTPDAAAGELMRFLAEAAWYPTALLPGQGVRWEAVDDRSARATLVDGPVSVMLTFQFNAEGLIDTVRAEARGRTVGGRVVPTPWEGRFRNYAERGGMRVPLEGEVGWILPQGWRPYWRGRIEQIAYRMAE